MGLGNTILIKRRNEIQDKDAIDKGKNKDEQERNLLHIGLGKSVHIQST